MKTVKFIPGTWQQQITCTFLGLKVKTNPIAGWGGLSKKSNVKTSKECPKLVVIHNILIVKKSNSWSIGDTQLLMIDSSEWYVHGDISEDHKSAIKIELSQLGQDYLNYLWFDITYHSTHSSNQPPTHPPIGGGVSINHDPTNHKSPNRIELFQLCQDLLNC